jgi:hypothetical protein
MQMSVYHTQKNAQRVYEDLRLFMTNNPACAVKLIDHNSPYNQQIMRFFDIRGRLPVKLSQTGQNKLFGFRIVLSRNYPFEAPWVYLDEPENPQVIEFIDYIDKGNIMMFDLLRDWNKAEQEIKAVPEPHPHPRFNIGTVVRDVYQLFNTMPPLPLDELFGPANGGP